MFKQDADFIWRLKRKFISAQEFAGTVAAVSVGNGTTDFIQVASSDITAMEMQDAGDMFATMWTLPYDLDVTKNMYFRVKYSVTGTDSAATLDWIVTYLAGITGTTVLVEPVTALTHTINVGNGGVQTVPSGTANIPAWTAYGMLDANTLSELNDWMGLKVEENAETGTPAVVHFHGLEISYSRRLLAGRDGMKQPSSRMTNVLGSTQSPGDFVY